MAGTRTLDTLPAGLRGWQRRHSRDRGPTVLVLDSGRARTVYSLTSQRISVRRPPCPNCAGELALEPVDDWFAGFARHFLWLRLDRRREGLLLLLRLEGTIRVRALFWLEALFRFGGLIWIAESGSMVFGVVMRVYRLELEVRLWLREQGGHCGCDGGGRGGERGEAE